LTIEFCAGIVDKNKSLEEIAVDEVREECGYEVKVSDMEKIISCRLYSFVFKIINTKSMFINNSISRLNYLSINVCLFVLIQNI